MKDTIKYFSAVLIIALITSCGWFKKKVEEKVNEKIDENLQRIDSSLGKSKMDSLMKQLDSLKINSDSVMNKNNKRSKN